MSNNTRTKQIILVSLSIGLAGFLFTRDVKGLIQPKEETQMEAARPAAQALNLDEVSATAKNLIGLNVAKEISALEKAYKAASGTEQTEKARQLAQKWDDLEQTAPSALYLEIIATKEPAFQNWLAAGDRFQKAFENTRDSLIQPVMLQKAHAAFTKALALDSGSTDAKTGLGITIVNGMGAPMQGITMLREVVEKDPKNFKANMNLGVFALKSGQFDKAVIRFNDIITHIKATPEAYFYLATAYENLGKNTEAIEAYENSKKLAANPTITSFVDKKVAELKK